MYTELYPNYILIKLDKRKQKKQQPISLPTQIVDPLVGVPTLTNLPGIYQFSWSELMGWSEPSCWNKAGPVVATAEDPALYVLIVTLLSHR